MKCPTPSSECFRRTFILHRLRMPSFGPLFTLAVAAITRRSCHYLNGVARLKDGVAIETALADLTRIAKDLEAQYPDSNRNQGATVAPLSEVIVGDVKPILLLLLGGAGLLLLIACINVASLLLVRSETRRRELAVRRALGATRARLIRQFVVEGLVIVGVGSCRWSG